MFPGPPLPWGLLRGAPESPLQLSLASGRLGSPFPAPPLPVRTFVFHVPCVTHSVSIQPDVTLFLLEHSGRLCPQCDRGSGGGVPRPCFPPVLPVLSAFLLFVAFGFLFPLGVWLWAAVSLSSLGLVSSATFMRQLLGDRGERVSPGLWSVSGAWGHGTRSAACALRCPGCAVALVSVWSPVSLEWVAPITTVLPLRVSASGPGSARMGLTLPLAALCPPGTASAGRLPFGVAAKGQRELAKGFRRSSVGSRALRAGHGEETPSSPHRSGSFYGKGLPCIHPSLPCGLVGLDQCLGVTSGRVTCPAASPGRRALPVAGLGFCTGPWLRRPPTFRHFLVCRAPSEGFTCLVSSNRARGLVVFPKAERREQAGGG